jgi:hypothetical protein
MSTRYKFVDKAAVYFTRDCYKKILLNSLRHCQQSQRLQLHAWVPHRQKFVNES